MSLRTITAIGTFALLAASAFGQASFTSSGYAENFNGMGATGTTRPAGWSHWLTPGSNTLFSATTTPAAIASALPAFTQRNVALGVFNQTGVNPPANQSATATTYGFNASLSSNTADRILASAGATSVGATAIQLSIVNNSDAPLSTVSFAYDFVALSNGTPQGGTTGTFPIGTESEIPGFRVFYSLGGSAGPWMNITGLNYSPAANSPVGLTANVSASNVTLNSSWAVGGTLTLRWFKDNENNSSPDANYGINNVSIVPAPGAAALLGLGGLLAGRRRR